MEKGAEARVARWFPPKPKNPNLGKFWRALDRLESIVVAIWNILQTAEIFW
jgi:hypothetical protein